METGIGEIYENFKVSFDWKIRNFATLSAESGQFCESPPIDIDSATWCIRLYPNGFDDNCSGQISIFMKKLRCLQTSNTIFRKFSIRKSNGTIYATCKGQKEYSRSAGLAWGWKEFVNRAELLEEIEDIAPDGVLTILCEFGWTHHVAKTSPSTVSGKKDAKVPETKYLWKNLVRNMKDSFFKQKYSDVMIKVQGQEFLAHRMVLASRSTVFEAMFEHDMTENRDRIVEINDSEPYFFADFLLYLYSSEVDKLSSEKVYGLYALSDKYDTQDLKKECVKFMECNLSTETVCDVLIVAEKYDEKYLGERAKSFVLQNANAILSSDQWAQFEKQSQILANQILKSIILEKALKSN